MRSIVFALPFCPLFNAQQLPLFFSYHTPEGELFLILLFVSTYEGDLLVGPLFAFAHFCAL
jgi:hypothetical protein